MSGNAATVSIGLDHEQSKLILSEKRLAIVVRSGGCKGEKVQETRLVESSRHRFWGKNRAAPNSQRLETNFTRRPV